MVFIVHFSLLHYILKYLQDIIIEERCVAFTHQWPLALIYSLLLQEIDQLKRFVQLKYDAKMPENSLNLEFLSDKRLHPFIRMSDGGLRGGGDTCLTSLGTSPLKFSQSKFKTDCCEISGNTPFNGFQSVFLCLTVAVSYSARKYGGTVCQLISKSL